MNDNFNVYDAGGWKAWFRDGSFYRPDGPYEITLDGGLVIAGVTMKTIS